MPYLPSLLRLFLLGEIVLFPVAFLILSIPYFFFRKKRSFGRLAGECAGLSLILSTVACVGLCVFINYALFETHITDHYSRPLTVEEARKDDCPIPVPDSAKNIQFVLASGGMQALEILVRFQAPVNICRLHVQTVLAARANQGFLPLWRLVPLNGHLSPEDGDLVGRAAWFDLEQIKKGSVVDDDAHDSDAQIWIDEDRGIFYCKITD